MYGSETSALKVSDNTQQLERTERMMVRWMCGVSLKDRKSLQLLDRLGIVGVAERVVRGRLRRFGHVERKSADDWVSTCREMSVVGFRRRGRGRDMHVYKHFTPFQKR